MNLFNFSCYGLVWITGFFSAYIGLLIPYLVYQQLPWPFHKLKTRMQWRTEATLEALGNEIESTDTGRSSQVDD